MAKFDELADDAKEHGLSLVILVENADPISQESGFWTTHRGTQITAVGLVRYGVEYYTPKFR